MCTLKEMILFANFHNTFTTNRVAAEARKMLMSIRFALFVTIHV